MEFEEVNNYIRTERSQVTTDGGPSFGQGVNFYNTLIQQPITRKPTLSNFVHRLKQHSSKTRFISQYKKMSVPDNLTSDDDGLSDDASIRVIDPSRTRDNDDYDYESEEEEEGVIELDILKKPVKRVKINEGANQVRGMKRNDSDSFIEPQGDLSMNERFITFDIAIDLIHKDVINKKKEITNEMKRIEYNKGEINKYKQELINMQQQLEIYHYSLNGEHLTDMKLHQLNSIKNIDKMKETKRKNLILKSRFDKYRKVMSLETRLIELEKKIKQAWKRDEIWVSIRDWGLISIILLSFLIVTLFMI